MHQRCMPLIHMIQSIFIDVFFTAITQIFVTSIASKSKNHTVIHTGPRKSKSSTDMSDIPHHRYIDTHIQNVIQKSSTATNTTGPECMNSEAQHRFVCWPKELDPEEPSTIVRWKRRLERDDDYLLAVMHLGSRVESALFENERIDILDMPLLNQVPRCPGSELDC